MWGSNVEEHGGDFLLPKAAAELQNRRFKRKVERGGSIKGIEARGKESQTDDA